MNPPPPAASLSDRRFAEAVIAAAVEAGGIILAIRAKGFGVEQKPDTSPVTAADRAAEAAILARLASIAPDIPVIAEEACSAGIPPPVGSRFFLVDPLDGTKEYVSGRDDFTVNIALIENGAPVFGVVFPPALGEIYVGEVGIGAWTAAVKDGVVGLRRPIRVRDRRDGPVDVVASKSHRTPETDVYIGRYRVGRLVAAGSSLKFCKIAAGEADLYPRLGPTMQWDTAAGDAVLRAAGGQVVMIDGRPLPYGPGAAAGVAAYRNPWFIAAGGITILL
jgi:3'(2'),5'-bisphosphate nucleotidase